MFGKPRQNSEYGQLNSRREERHDLKKWHSRLFYIIYAAISYFMIDSVFFRHGHGDRSAFFIHYDSDMFTGSDNFRMVLYFAIALFFLFIVWSLFFAKSKDEIEDGIFEKVTKKHPIKATDTISLKISTYLDMFVYYLFYPISHLILGIEAEKAADRRIFFLRHGYLSHLKMNFFQRTIRQVDGYERVDTIEIFKDYPVLFCSEHNTNKAKLSKEFKTFLSLFRDRGKLEDIFLIAEGYLTNSKQKFDKLLSEKEYKDILTKRFSGKIDDFRVYNGKDEILFSVDLIKDLSDDEYKRFEVFVKKYATTPTGLSFTRMYREYFDLLKKDKNTLAMIRSLHAPAPLKEEDVLTDRELVQRIQFLFGIYFRFFCFYYIVNQYINLPAGTVVVRMEDYTFRMITEIYDSKVIVAISPQKNDGTSKSFKGDALVNMFLIMWNYYNHSVENSFHDRVYNIFNLRDEVMEKAQSGEEESNMLASEIQEELKKDWSFIEQDSSSEDTEEESFIKE